MSDGCSYHERRSAAPPKPVPVDTDPVLEQREVLLAELSRIADGEEAVGGEGQT